MREFFGACSVRRRAGGGRWRADRAKSSARRAVASVVLSFVALALAGTPAPAQDENRLSLDECLRLAFERSHDLRQAAAGAEQVRGGYVSSWGNVLPDVRVSASGSKSWSRISEFEIQPGVVVQIPGTDVATTRYGMNGSVSQNLINLESLYSFRQSRRNWESTRVGLEATKQDIAIDVVGRFYTVVTNQRNVELRRESLQLSEDQLRRTNALFELGAVPKADVLESQVLVSQSRRDLIDAENQFTISKGRLNLAVGRPIEAPLEPDYQPITIDEQLPDAETALRAARDHRPDFEQSQLAWQAAKLGKSSASWAVWPSLSGRLFYSKDASTFGEAFDFGGMNDIKNQAAWGYGVTLSVPVFDGQVTKGRKIQAAGALRESGAALEKKERELRLEVSEAILNLQAARASLAVSADEIAAAEENQRLREAMYDHGAATILELIQARVDLTNARFDTIMSETRMQMAWYEYLRATGVDLRTGQPF